MVTRAEVLVDHPLEEHALEARRYVGALPDRRNLIGVEMTEEIPPEVRQIQLSGVGRHHTAPLKKRVALLAHGLGLRGRHLEPSHRRRSGVPPRVKGADLGDAVVAGANPIRLIVDADNRLARQHVEPFLEGMNVRRDCPARAKLVDAQARVKRPVAWLMSRACV